MAKTAPVNAKSPLEAEMAVTDFLSHEHPEWEVAKGETIVLPSKRPFSSVLLETKEATNTYMVNIVRKGDVL